LMMSIVSIQNVSHVGLENLSSEWSFRMIYILIIFIGSEIIVDWIKHGFMNKSNHLPNYYTVFRTVLCRDVLYSKFDQTHPNYYSISRRFGVINEPLAIIFLRAIYFALISFKAVFHL